MSATDVLLYSAYATAWSASRRVPERVAHRAFRTLADVAWRRRVRGVTRLENNLARVRPEASAGELRELSRWGMRSYFRYWCEAFRLPEWSQADILDRVVVHEEQRFRAAVADGHGVVAALPHMGNWDLAGAWACATGTPVVTVAERVRPERLFERFVAYRERLGIEILPATGGREPFGTLVERLRAGGLVCLVADRDLSERGLEVSFFGEPARMPAGPAALAVRTGAALLPVTLWYEGARMHIHFDEPMQRPQGTEVRPGTSAIHTMTQRLADAYATGIARHPADWHMLQRLWSADLDVAERGIGVA